MCLKEVLVVLCNKVREEKQKKTIYRAAGCFQQLKRRTESSP